MRNIVKNYRQWTIALAALTALVGVLTLLNDITNSSGDSAGNTSERSPREKTWPAGSVEEQVARHVLDVAESARCPTGTVRLIDAAISFLPASAHTGAMPLAKAHASIQLPIGAAAASINVIENGQGATLEIAQSQALSRLLTKITSRLNAALAC